VGEHRSKRVTLIVLSTTSWWSLYMPSLLRHALQGLIILSCMAIIQLSHCAYALAQGAHVCQSYWGSCQGDPGMVGCWQGHALKCSEVCQPKLVHTLQHCGARAAPRLWLVTQVLVACMGWTLVPLRSLSCGLVDRGGTDTSCCVLPPQPLGLLIRGT
jgi:hypothetical protein